MRSNRRWVLLLLILAACTVMLCMAVVKPRPIQAAADRTSAQAQAVQLPTDDRPNVVLFLVDTLRADKLGCYGSPMATSPEIDALAEKGVRFEHVVAPCSWTRPTMASIITGCYPRTLGLYAEENEILPSRFHTLAELLHGAAYKTLGATANPHLNSVFNFHQGFDAYDDSTAVYTFMGPKNGETLFTKSKVRSSPDMCEAVLDYADSAGEGPHFVQLVLMEVHEWCRGERSLVRPEFEGCFGTRPRWLYLEAVRQFSHDLGAFVEQLSARPGWANTLFVIVSDHGEGLSDHPNVEKSRYHGRLLYESQLMVPLILYQPGKTFPVAEVKRPVRLIDLVPTLLAYLDVPIPEGIEGTSLLPLIRGDAGPLMLPEYFVAETKLRGHDKIAAYGPDWKYIENRDGHKGVNPRELQRIGVTENGVRTDRIAERIVGANGIAMEGAIEGTRAYKYQGPTPNPYEQEHTDLIRSIRSGRPLNEGKAVAESTMTAILGRMSAYTGRAMKWDWAIKSSKLDLTPPRYELGDLPVGPVAVPGKTPLV